MKKIILILLIVFPFSVFATTPDDVKVNSLLKIAELRLKSGNLSSAESELEKVLEIDPENKKALEMLSEISLPEKDSDTLPTNTENNKPGIKIDYDYSKTDSEDTIFGIAKSRLPIYVGVLGIALALYLVYFFRSSKAKSKDDIDPLSGL